MVIKFISKVLTLKQFSKYLGKVYVNSLHHFDFEIAFENLKIRSGFKVGSKKVHQFFGRAYCVGLTNSHRDGVECVETFFNIKFLLIFGSLLFKRYEVHF